MKKILLLFLFVGLLSTAGILMYGSIYTNAGSKILTDTMISKFVENESSSYSSAEGSLKEGIVYKNLEIKDIKGLPKGAVLKVQELNVNLHELSFNGIEIKVENARLSLPDSEAIVLSGSFRNMLIDMNVFSVGFTVRELLTYYPDLKKYLPVQGDISSIDLCVTGSYLEPSIKGSFTADRIVYNAFMLTNSPWQFDIQLKDLSQDIRIFGNANLERGDIVTKRALVQLTKGNLVFSGPVDEVQFDIIGNSEIEKTQIDISLKGTINNPEIALYSDPSYSQQKLMVMLISGKSWKSVEDSLDSGLNSAALTKDFVDYFFFAGRSNQFVKRFGINDFSVKFEENKKGISAKKELSKNLEIGYGIEQTKTNGQTADISQKLGGEVKVTNQLSVGVEREIKKSQADILLNKPADENNNKVFLKYKKNF